MSLTKFAARAELAGLLRMTLVSSALFAAAPAWAQEPSLWDKALGSVGLGGKQDAQQQAAPTQPVQAPQAARAPQAAQAPQAPQAVQTPQAAQEPGMWDRVTSSVGLGKKTEPSTIDYSERPKLAVPQQRDLPRPAPMPERQVNRAAEQEALTRPPADYAEKVKGADGKVEGLREGDVAKEKKFLNFF
jgi:hypothetical protein